MKTITFSMVMLTIVILTSCGNNTQSKVSATINDTAQSAGTMNKVQAPATPINGIVVGYLQLKNSLVADNGNGAATAGNQISDALKKVDEGSFSAEQKKIYDDIKDDMQENAEHISANAGDIDHQREHFEMLSKDMADLLKTFGNGGQALYKDFCPMFNSGKGATWISEIKGIKNPYLGGKMPTCGSVKEIIQ